MLPMVSKSELDIAPIDWTGLLPRRFMNEGELEVLCALVRSVNPASVIEFGVNEGRTALALLREVPTIKRYQGVDVLPGYVTQMRVQRREVPQDPGKFVQHDPRFELILRRRGSHDLAATDLIRADVAFIDGDHSRAGVEQDTRLARALVRKGGMIIWHDYNDEGKVEVKQVLDEFSAKGANLTHIAGTWLAFEVIT